MARDGEFAPARTQAATQTETEAAAERERRRRRELAEQLKDAPAPGASGAARARTFRPAVAALAVAAAVVVLVGISLRGGSDTVSEAQKVSWAAAFAAAPPQVAHRVPAAEIPAALDGMGLTPDQKTTLQTALAEGRTQLVYLTLTDVMQEDLDRVRIDSEGYSAEVTILNRTTRVVFPEPSSGVVNVTGTYDGGGGITIAITSGETPVNLPFLQVGQVVGIPVVVGP